MLKYINRGSELLYLNKVECLQTNLSGEDVIQLAEKALEIHGNKELEMPAKIGIHPLQDTFIHAMPASIPGERVCGLKWAAGFPDNRKKFKLPQISALMILNDGQTGFPIAIMDGTWLTTIRTAAVSAVGVKYFGRRNSETFGMIGCGELGKKHVELMPTILPHLSKIFIYDRKEALMDNLISEVQPKINAKILKAKSIEEVIKSCSIVTSATIITARPQPQIKDEWITNGQTILQCDLHSLYEDRTIKRAHKYIVDSLEQNMLFYEYGYYPDGLPEIYGELGEVVARHKKGRENEDELIINNNIGMAVVDLVVGKEIFERALEKGLGQTLIL